jgi:transaldolase / glucose-6-phosphate isomerase
MTSPIQELRALGQSPWLDNIRRQLVSSGELARLRDEGISGVTSNPTIFEKAVSGSTDYDEALVRLVGAGHTPDEILWELMLDDIRAAADVFRPVYDETKGADGFVSIEVSPVLARDTQGTIEMARDLFTRAARPNVMVKIPATVEGLPAIRTMIGEGVNINVTLIFSTERYDEVVEAFMHGMEDLQRAGGDLSKVASVASFFVSRVDTKVDKLLDAKIAQATTPVEKDRIRGLYGKAAIANSKMAYEHFTQFRNSSRWELLQADGARPQRCLWASTSTKDPRYPDTMYVEELIGPDTVDTVPPATLAAFREHGEVRRSLDEDVPGARRALRELAEVGIDLRVVTAELEVEGVDLFAKSFANLLKAIENEAADIRAGRGPRQWHSLGTLQPVVDDAVAKLQREDAPRKVWSRDPSLWVPGTQPERWMGWLNVPEKMLEQADKLEARAEEAREYSDVVLLGMGGSSLCPDVFRSTFGRIEGHPRLHVLDTTDPETILGVRESIDLGRTLFIAASKSGGTTETLSHLAYFWEEVRRTGTAKAERQFAVITDPGSGLERLAAERDFRWIFLNPPDIGGRYSALSYFGLVPGALMGLDVRELLERAHEMAHACDATVPVEKNPGMWLGAVLGALGNHGRNKVTLVPSPQVATFGYWLEQLLAESTGKQGRGLVPVEGEPLGRPEAYGQDRLFVRVRVNGDSEDDPAVRALADAGQPMVTLSMRDLLDLGGEFLRWELATAAAGSLLGIDPFDQPNVQESKDNTKRVLAEFAAKGKLPEAPALPASEAGAAVVDLLGKAREGSYLALMAYTTRTEASDAAIGRARAHVRDRTRLATTAGYGPRFLHSTGQLHKGGPPVGLFLQVVQRDRRDVEVPGEPYTFSILKQAQALGDLASLQSRNYPVLRVSLGDEPEAGWRELADSIEAAVR